jgi:squalene synthase HpnC
VTLIGAEPSDLTPAGIPAADAVMGRAQSENFPVASHLLPRGARADLLAIYGFARLVDELGDTFAGDRLAALDWLEAELDRAFAGTARHPLLVRLQPALRERALPRGPFARLIEANRVDQRVTRYQTWEQLRDYCTLSANPVGELVLAVLGLASPQRITLSDSICTGLQLIEHCQDVAEDLAAGRVYLPAEDLARFGCTEEQLHRAHAEPQLREVLAFEVSRAHGLFDAGGPLIAQVGGRARLALAGFLGGGHATAEAIERAGYDVLAGPPRASRLRLLAAIATTLAGSRAEPR